VFFQVSFLNAKGGVEKQRASHLVREGSHFHFGFCNKKIQRLFTILYDLTDETYMNYWLMKTEPSTFSWDDLVRDKKTGWDGVRNFQARNNLKAMKKGDLAFIYHSMDDKAVVGIAKITKENYPDPKDKDWVAVEISPEKKLKRPVTLAEVKADKRLTDMVLVKSSRLSVQPVTAAEFDMIVALSEKKVN
jgi:predicted RNA-binding protein with PUA-like domain